MSNQAYSFFKYRTAGVREYWIVDPTKELIMIYQFEKETMEQYSFGEKKKLMMLQ